MKKISCVFAFLLVWTTLFAQKEANIWYYGRQVGLDFNTLPPKPLLNGALVSNESSAVMADKKTGQLLFYSDGSKVWNRAHRIMPNGNGLLAAQTTSTQGALIVPAPGNENLFHFFTVATPTYYNFTTPGLFYSVINMQLDRGQGDIDISQKNISLLNEVSEKLTAIPHQNGQDYWVITHGWNNSLFYVYLINSQGVSKPKTYSSGTIHKDTTEDNSEAAGYLKASPDGKRLACAVTLENKARPFELYDFDSATGQITNYRSLGNFRGQYGVSFSPDNTKLYLTLNPSTGQVSPDSSICQFDLRSSSPGGSVPYQYLRYQVVTGLNPYVGGPNPDKEKPILLAGALQLGADGKLYSASPYVINRPNAKGDSCLITPLDPLLSGKPNRGFTLGLPNFIQSTFNNLLPKDGSAAGDCSLSQLLNIYPNPTANLVTVQLGEGCQSSFTYRLYNVLGQLLTDSAPASSVATVDLSGYPAGCYFIEVKAGQQQKTFKVIKV